MDVQTQIYLIVAVLGIVSITSITLSVVLFFIINNLKRRIFDTHIPQPFPTVKNSQNQSRNTGNTQNFAYDNQMMQPEEELTKRYKIHSGVEVLRKERDDYNQSPNSFPRVGSAYNTGYAPSELSVMSDENYSYLNYKTNNNNNDAPTDFKSQIQARSLNRGGNKKSQNKRIVDGTHNGQRNPSQYNSNIILDSEATEGSSFHETAYFNERAKNPKLEVY